MKNYFRYLILTSLLYLTLSHSGFAQRSQTKFIEPASEKISTLNADRKNKFEKIGLNKYYKNVQMVSIGDLSALVKTTNFRLPYLVKITK